MLQAKQYKIWVELHMPDVAGVLQIHVRQARGRRRSEYSFWKHANEIKRKKYSSVRKRYMLIKVLCMPVWKNDSPRLSQFRLHNNILYLNSPTLQGGLLLLHKPINTKHRHKRPPAKASWRILIHQAQIYDSVESLAAQGGTFSLCKSITTENTWQHEKALRCTRVIGWQTRWLGKPNTIRLWLQPAHY